MTNDYIEYYDKYKISPVKQNLTNLENHFYIREMLYQSLGTPATYFKDKNVLEVGPGGGYNSIVTASFQPKYYQLIDANPTGIKEIRALFNTLNLQQEHVFIENCFIEQFQTDKKFDIAICENMLPCLKNNYDILNKIDSLLIKKGVLIISCADEISIFYDITRRLLANILVQREKITNFDDKVNLFVEAFESHLKTLKGFYKLPYDWCADNLLGKSLYNSSLSVSDVLLFFKDRYKFYQTSPNIIEDDQWYKEIPLSTNAYNNRKQTLFQERWHNTFHYKIMSQKRDCTKNIELRTLCRAYFDCIEQSEDEGYSVEIKNKILKLLKLIGKNIGDIDDILELSINEIIEFLEKDDITSKSIANNFHYFKSAFGKGQTFLSLIKQLD